MKKLTSKTEFPRSWKDNFPEEGEVICITQPYISGLYLAISNGSRTILQTTIDYNNLPKLIKKLKENEAVKDLYIDKLGTWLKEPDFQILNS